MEDRIGRELMRLQDLKYREFQCGLIPTVDPETVIGVRTPALRAFAKALAKTEAADAFLRALPHQLFEENQLHAFLLSEMKDFGRCVQEVCRFLPHIDNWATCDQLSPKVFKKHRAELLPHVRAWIGAKEPYTIRFGVGMLMQHYLDEDFDPAYPALVAGLRSEEYYVNMMIAWYFATALAKQYDGVLPFLEDRRLGAWTHNKAIQKAVESYRITPSQKDHLRTLRVRRG
ncbi:MAG: DNA alkylation repair protein [Ruminococcaceae bacterium]|nr:DNA alkylation repair protein [Oscillospiraceae bacterium]